MFEPRRFVELRKKDFMTQALSAESLGMGLFYTCNVFWIQFYLGAALCACSLTACSLLRVEHGCSTALGMSSALFAQAAA